ncbi:hypothetical protein MMC26_006290 [Xylographa opegraphella]|nr:hypothetical protein [Xylographa opegraphella]
MFVLRKELNECLNWHTSSPTPQSTSSLIRPQNARACTGFDSAARRTISRSRSSSVWTAPSPGQAIRSKSPSDPPLPAYSHSNSYLKSLQSPAQHQRSDSSAYYTAEWGSPYDLPSSVRAQIGGHRYQQTNSTTANNGSPPQRPRREATYSPSSATTQTPYSELRRDSRVAVPSGRLSLPARNRPPIIKPRWGFTQEWLNNNLRQTNNEERGNWLSDESGVSDTEAAPRIGPLKGIGIPDSWLEFGEERIPSSSETVYTQARRSLPQTSKCQEGHLSISQSTAHHKAIPSDVTLKQRDFDDIFRSSRVDNNRIADMATSLQGLPSELPALNLSSSVSVEKPLPPQPINRATPEPPALITAVSSTELPFYVKRPSLSSLASFQRPRKRVVWRGKTCVIALPLDDGTDHRRQYLTPRDFDAIIAHWHERGFNTRGFDLAEIKQGDILDHGQSRDVYPDPQEWERETRERNFKVRIPDRKAWDDYVNDLKEQKLRALGVSFGDEDVQTRKSPGLPMSRQDSAQNPMLPPPLPEGPPSVTNARINIAPTFSPSLTSSTGAFDRGPPVPATSQQYAATSARPHMPKQSVVINGQLYNSPPFPRQQPTPPMFNTWPQQQYLGSVPASRGVSPLVSGRRQSLQGPQSPVSPMPDMPFERYHLPQNPGGLQTHPPNASVIEQSRFQHPLPHQYQDLYQPVPLRESLDLNNDLQPIKYVSQPEIASPLPQGHRHNLSESLQKEIDNAEYHLEESIRRQLDEDDEISLQSTANDHASMYATRAPKMSSVNGIKLGDHIATPMSDLDTNPSNSGSPTIRSPEAQRRNSISMRSTHVPRSSTSKLNVNAREFVFDPQKSFAPKMFSFLGNLKPSAAADTTANDGLQVQPKQNEVASHGRLNVAAPAFMPSNSTVRLPSQEFSFSSSLPSLKPDAPVFKPNRGQSLGPGSGQADMESQLPRIFGNLDFSEAVKSVKKSKAIPIVRPNITHLDDDRNSDFQEDDEGRITQGDGRQKRMRRADDDGDSVPVFATPSQEAVLELGPVVDTNLQAKDDANLNDLLSRNDTLASPAEKATDQLKDLLNKLDASGASSPVGDHSSVGGVEKESESFEFEDKFEAASFNLARPRSSTPVMTGFNQDEFSDSMSQRNDTAANNAESSTTEDGPNGEEISLTATIQPSEWNADTAIYQSDVDSNLSISDSKAVNDGLTASRYVPRADSLEIVSPAHESYLSHKEDFSSSARSSSVERYIRDDGIDPEPSFQEIDAVMKHLNEDSEAGVERLKTTEMDGSEAQTHSRSATRSSLPIRHGTPVTDHHLYALDQHKVPSSSPNRLQQPFQYLPQRSYGSSESAAAELVARSARYSPSYKPAKLEQTSLDSPIHRLNDATQLPVSDWDDVVSSTEEAKFQSRSSFFDHRINNLVGAAVREQLKSLENNISEISNSVAQLVDRSSAGRLPRSASAQIKNSDADDEDDDGNFTQTRAMSPLKERKYERLKASLLESVANQGKANFEEGFAEIMGTLTDLKTALKQQKSDSIAEIESTAQEVIDKHLPGESAPIVSSRQSATSEKYQLHISGLESMLKIAESRADEELKARILAENALEDSQQLLRLAQADAAAQRESAEETERSLRDFHEERLQAVQRSTLLEITQVDLQRTVAGLNEKNATLEDTLEEYRLSSAQWREEIDEAKTNNSNLDRTIHALKAELEDGIRGRHMLRTKLNSLQEEMTNAARNIARDQSSWRHKEEEHKARHEMQNARLEAEARTRERLELEIERLEAQEKEAMKSRFLVDQVQGENSRLITLVNELRQEHEQARKDSARYQRELHDAKETGRLDIQRVQNAMEADMEKANQEVQIVRKDCESLIARLQTQLEDAQADAKALKSRYELMLEEASESKDEALRNAAEARDAALQEHYRFHEHSLDELKRLHEQVLAATLERKDHALANASEDKRLTELYLGKRINLADEKILHYQDRITHLEEKLEIARSAAQAAVQAAQSARGSPSPAVNRDQVSVSRGSDVNGKISPQALRESILVLQEQLHQRESQIENLEQELANLDKDAPTKIKDRDIEISWLRELLGVRIDDLQDIIGTLSQPSFDRDAVKDAAIRLKANLQMEQQEKERAIAGGQSFPSLASISNLAASPRTLPLAAAAAWGNWRKGQSTFASLSEMANGSASQTPSRSSPQSFLSGLLTPPSTNIRQTPQPTAPAPAPASRSKSAEYRPLRGYSTPRQSTSRAGGGRSIHDHPPPETPQLLRKTSYDQDAQSGHYSLERYAAEDDESTADGNVRGEDEGPFGPNIET